MIFAAKPCTLTLPGILTVVHVIFHHLSKFFLQVERSELSAESSHTWAQQAVEAVTLVQQAGSTGYTVLTGTL